MTDQNATKILIVEDNDAIRSSLEFALKKKYNVVTAVDGEACIEMAKQENPSLILLDLVMPKIGGFEALEALKKNSDTADIPVVVFSNLSQDTDVSEAKERGAVDFIVKSNFSLTEIVERIDSILNEQ